MSSEVTGTVDKKAEKLETLSKRSGPGCLVNILCACGSHPRAVVQHKSGTEDDPKSVRTRKYEDFNYEAYLGEEARKRLEHLAEQSAVPYDKQNPKHEEDLMRLWSAAFPNRPLGDRISDQWKEIGFQGRDPATDFRGAGYFGLLNMIYFGEKEPAAFAALVTSGREYGFAVASINTTALLKAYLRIQNADQRKKDLLSTKYVASKKALINAARLFETHEHAFEELYCCCVLLVDHIWKKLLSQDPSFSLLRFAEVFLILYDRLETVLCREPKTIKEVQDLCAVQS